MKEIRHFSPTVPIVLVGTKMDILEDNKILDTMAKEGLRPIS